MDEDYCKKLAKVLVCPKTKKPLVYDAKIGAFLDKDNNIIYDIKDGIPALLEEECNTFDKDKIDEEME